MINVFLFGQDQAVKTVSSAIKMAKVSSKDTELFTCGIAVVANDTDAGGADGIADGVADDLVLMMVIMVVLMILMLVL